MLITLVLSSIVTVRTAWLPNCICCNCGDSDAESRKTHVSLIPFVRLLAQIPLLTPRAINVLVHSHSKHDSLVVNIDQCAFDRFQAFGSNVCVTRRDSMIGGAIDAICVDEEWEMTIVRAMKTIWDCCWLVKVTCFEPEIFTGKCFLFRNIYILTVLFLSHSLFSLLRTGSIKRFTRNHLVDILHF